MNISWDRAPAGRLTRKLSPETRALLLRLRTVAVYLVLGFGALVMVAPFLWMFTTSFRPVSEAFSLPPRWLPGFNSSLESYRRLLASDVPIGRFFWNSAVLATSVTLGYVATTTIAGYAFARLRFPFKNALFVLLLVSLMVPVQTTLVPLFLLMRWLGLVDSQWSIIVPGLTGAFAPGMSGVFGIFMMRQFFLTLPKELFEAARVDNAGHFRTFWAIAAPLAGPQIAALSVIIFTTTWNDYFMPLVFLNSVDQMVLPVGIMSIRDPVGNSSATSEVIAAVSLSILPVLIVFLIAQRWIVDSFVRAGVKG
ncbi:MULTISPECIES: carbohydrate ABC transporter permease [Rhizobium]|uniref:Carbohydrate ABC transporter permease n=1 Tax=Rhizobium phaseoli TaxID=396 RepID=A0A7X6EZ51_9HYPH|nr:MULTISPECIES: carbohydrate ABC transporter permease [Rhizobium]MDE8758968.1 carbohydrate ABC transporter permease [Rhizobium sp. CBK13]MDK4724600.1 carbohydrate ABC transporter permease [Rhizobium phaseoli]NKE88595.1 carbohydrate ABC transporter permease [Rhizobium phaseoli]NKF10239.1 carbohydrate ABC transporter permease [Rhizobium phaseoli]QPK11581.1 carbohydrate ABC transporter permease [Rhizobium phaseoli]